MHIKNMKLGLSNNAQKKNFLVNPFRSGVTFGVADINVQKNWYIQNQRTQV